MIPIGLIQQEQWEPIVPPGEVAFWPPQPGWYVVFALVLILAGYFGYRYWKQHKANRYRRLANAELERMNQSTPDLGQLNRLLKAVAIKTFGRKTVAGLHGEDWTGFLDQTGPKAKLGSNFKTLQQHYYAKQDQTAIPAANWSALIQASIVWTRTHKNK